jgi:hypothetical protein
MNDAIIIDRLRDAADRIEVDLTLDDVRSRASTRDRRPQGRPARALVAAACVLLLVGLSVVLARRGGDPAEPAAATWAPPVSVPPDEPTPGAIVAHVASRPDWLGDLGPGRRTGGQRTGRWVATAIGIPTADGFADPIAIAAFDGSWSTLDAAAPVVLGGTTYRTVTIGDWRALATTDEPTLVAHGEVAIDLLRDVLAASRLVTSGADITVALDRVPPGYQPVVAPHQLADDVVVRRTLAEGGGRLAINEVSDWVDPALYAASTGADIARQDIGGLTGWSGMTTSGSSGAITFLVWEPQPGVLFEIDSTDGARTIADLIELAAATTAVAASEWDVLHPG